MRVESRLAYKEKRKLEFSLKLNGDVCYLVCSDYLMGIHTHTHTHINCSKHVLNMCLYVNYTSIKLKYKSPIINMISTYSLKC